MVTDYEATLQMIQTLLTTNATALGVKPDFIVESSERLDFNVPTPFIYYHPDFGKAKVQGNHIVEMLLDFFIVVEDQSVAKAKIAAMEIVGVLTGLLRETQYCKFPSDYLELFDEFSNRCVMRLSAIIEIVI